MKKTNLVAAVAAVALLLGACTMQKRHYTAGYHVEWKHGKNDVAAKPANTHKSVISEIQPVNFTQVAVNDETKEELIPYQSSESVAEQVSTSAEINSNKMDNYAKTDVVKKSKEEKVSLKEKVVVIKQAKKAAKSSSEPSKGLYIVLAIFIPFVAVGLATDWGEPTWWNLLWCLLCGIPGIIHAFIVLNREGKI